MRVYLAGPDVFLPDPRTSAKGLKERCTAHGVEGVFPLDAELKLDHLSKAARARAIYEANVALIRSCDGLVANMAPFRGPSMDVGTAFEMGYAAALGLPVVGYTDGDEGNYLDRVLVHFRGCLTVEEGRWRDPTGMEVEDFDQVDNLMMSAGADVITQGFDQALLAMRALLRARRERLA